MLGWDRYAVQKSFAYLAPEVDLCALKWAVCGAPARQVKLSACSKAEPRHPVRQLL